MNYSIPCVQEKKKEILRVLSVFLCLCLFLTVFMAGNLQVAFCADGEEGDESADSFSGTIQGIVNLGATEIYGIMRAVVIPVAICMVGYAGLLFLAGGSKGVDKAKSLCVTAFVGVMFVAFAPVIGNQIGEWVADSYDGDLSSYNPLD